ncbi:MAG: hypothetical protein WCL51_05570 [Bacteroidota bacterium]
MKKILSIVFIISVIGLLLTTSCKHKDNTQYKLAQIDSLTLILDKTELMLTELNDDSIKAMMNDTHLMHDVLLSVSKTKLKTLEISDNNQLDSIDKQFKEYIEIHTKNLEEFKYSRKQLTDLKYDLEQHNVNEKKFDEYYQTENTSVNNLFNIVSSSLDKVKQNIEKYKLMNPTIKKLMFENKFKINKENTVK